jgi:hypothetical protein
MTTALKSVSTSLLLPSPQASLPSSISGEICLGGGIIEQRLPLPAV